MSARSILGSVVISEVVTIGENLLILPLSFASYLLKADLFQHIYRFSPGYNLIRLGE